MEQTREMVPSIEAGRVVKEEQEECMKGEAGGCSGGSLWTLSSDCSFLCVFFFFEIRIKVRGRQ